MTSILIEVVGLAGVIIISCSGIPQLYKTIKTRSVKDLSSTFFLMLLVGIILLSIYSLSIGDIVYCVGNSISFIVTLLILINILRWR